jgi:hypothetical protein
VGAKALPHHGRPRSGRETQPTTFETLTLSFRELPFHALGCIMDQGVWEIALNENNRAVVALLVGFVVGGVVGFDGAFAVFSIRCSAPSCELRNAL